MGDRGHNRHEPKRGELLCPFSGELHGSGTPSNKPTLWPGPRSTSAPSGISSRLAIIDMGQIGCGGCALFSVEVDPHRTQVAWAEAYLHTKWHLRLVHPAVWPQRTLTENWGLCPCPIPITNWHLDPCSRLATINVRRKLGALPLLGRRRGLGPHLTQCRLGRGLPSYQVAF